MKKVFGIFRIRKDERWMSLVMLVLLVSLNALVILKYYGKFSVFNKDYFRLFVKTFHISGYDPVTYCVVSHWDATYNIYRHPLLAFFMYIPYQINHALMSATGINCVQFVVAVILIFCALYSFIFLYRIFKEVIELQRIDAILLSFFTFSFAYVLVASIVPDHFVMSMFMLILTLYVCGKKMKKNKPLTKWQTILFFIITAGISLNNGVKIFIANLFTNGKRFFHPLNLILAIILPSVLIWMFARYEYSVFQYPKWHARQVARAKFVKREKAKTLQLYKDTASTTDSATIAAGVKRILTAKAIDAYQKQQRDPNIAHQGKPIKKGEFWNWTDVSTSRAETFVENLFGESIVLHQDYLLSDTLTGRPVIVHYKWLINYVIEGIIVLLFVMGLWCGRRSRYMWLAASFMAFDMLLHMVIGFGINEIYIMSPHWAFVITIVMAYLFKRLGKGGLKALRITTGCLLAYLYIYNITLIVQYLI
jgi:hypothetical protein